MKITYWSDYMCPFCYIGETNLMKALQKTRLLDKVELEMKSFELYPEPIKDPDVYPAKTIAKKYGIPEEHAISKLAMMDAKGRESGLDMHCERVKHANTMDAHRLTKYAQSLGDQKVVDSLVELIFKNVYTYNTNIGDKKVLLKIAEEAGLKDLKKVEEVLNSDMFEHEVQYDEHEAAKEGVHGIPYYIIGEKAYPGAYTEEEFIKLVNEAYGNYSNLKGESKGVTCTKEGCSIK